MKLVRGRYPITHGRREACSPIFFFGKIISIYLVHTLATLFYKVTLYPFLIISLIILRAMLLSQTFLQYFYKLLR